MFNQDPTTVANTATNRIPQQPAMDYPFGQANTQIVSQDMAQFSTNKPEQQGYIQAPFVNSQPQEQYSAQQASTQNQFLDENQTFNQGATQDQTSSQDESESQNQRQPQLPTQYKPIPEEVIVEWTAPNRPFKKRNRQFYSTVAIIVLLISLILFFAGQVLPIAVVISVAFMVYVLYSIPPGVANNKITTYGVRTDEMIYYWDELSRFWFEKQLDDDMLLFELNRFPWRVILLIKSDEIEDFRELLSEVLLEQKPPDTQIDKWANWLKEKLPLE